MGMNGYAVGPLEIVVFVAVFAMLATSLFPKRRRRQPRRYRTEYARLVAQPRPVADAADQLRVVMGATFSAKRVLSRSEARVMTAAEAAIAAERLPWRVMAQVAPKKLWGRGARQPR